eukprot:ctg_361.g128
MARMTAVLRDIPDNVSATSHPCSLKKWPSPSSAIQSETESPLRLLGSPSRALTFSSVARPSSTPLLPVKLRTRHCTTITDSTGHALLTFIIPCLAPVGVERQRRTGEAAGASTARGGGGGGAGHSHSTGPPRQDAAHLRHRRRYDPRRAGEQLGTIAKSGTSQFLKQVRNADNDAATLIGMFGVGFYSAFLVSDRVEVVSRHFAANSSQYRWLGSDLDAFTVSPDEAADLDGGQHGTCVTLHLKHDDVDRYADVEKVEQLVTKYSQFTEFPIYLYKPVTAGAGAAAAKATHADFQQPDGSKVDEATDELLVEDAAASDGGTSPAETRYEYVRVNRAKPLWLREPSTIAAEEYRQFYKDFTGDYGDPAEWTHFRGEGEVEFRALLFVPQYPAFDLFDATAKQGREAPGDVAEAPGTGTHPPQAAAQGDPHAGAAGQRHRRQRLPLVLEVVRQEHQDGRDRGTDAPRQAGEAAALQDIQERRQLDFAGRVRVAHEA